MIIRFGVVISVSLELCVISNNRVIMSEDNMGINGLEDCWQPWVANKGKTNNINNNEKNHM